MAVMVACPPGLLMPGHVRDVICTSSPIDKSEYDIPHDDDPMVPLGAATTSIMSADMREFCCLLIGGNWSRHKKPRQTQDGAALYFHYIGVLRVAAPKE